MTLNLLGCIKNSTDNQYYFEKEELHEHTATMVVKNIKKITCSIFGHKLQHKTYGCCLNGCGWTFFRPSGIISDHQEFRKLLKSISL